MRRQAFWVTIPRRCALAFHLVTGDLMARTVSPPVPL